MSLIPTLGELIGRPPRQRDDEPAPPRYMAALTLSSEDMHAWTWQGWTGGGCNDRGDVVLVSQEQLDMFVTANRVRFDVLRMAQTASGAVIDYRRDGRIEVVRHPAEIKPNQYWRCNTCGWVMGPQGQRPGRNTADEPYGWTTECPQCCANGRQRSGYTPTEVIHPPRPSNEAIARDTRECEAAIRATYRRLRPNYPGYDVPLTAIREALGNRWDRETVDAALTKLGAHDDVFLHGRSHNQTNAETQAAALAYGGEYRHGIVIDRDRGAGVSRTLQVIRSIDQRTAESMLAPLSAADTHYIAERMDVDTRGSLDDVKARIAVQSEMNRKKWLDDARQEREDGSLLYRADHEPEWVAGWTDAERQAAREAAQRMLQWGGGNSADHRGYYERARRYL